MNKDIEIKKFIGKELMLLRKDYGLSNETLAAKINIAPSTLSRYENGKGKMQLEIIEKIVSACDSNIFIFFNNCFAKLQK